MTVVGIGIKYVPHATHNTHTKPTAYTRWMIEREEENKIRKKTKEKEKKTFSLVSARSRLRSHANR